MNWIFKDADPSFVFEIVTVFTNDPKCGAIINESEGTKPFSFEGWSVGGDHVLILRFRQVSEILGRSGYHAATVGAVRTWCLSKMIFVKLDFMETRINHASSCAFSDDTKNRSILFWKDEVLFRFTQSIDAIYGRLPVTLVSCKTGAHTLRAALAREGGWCEGYPPWPFDAWDPWKQGPQSRRCSQLSSLFTTFQ